MGENQSKLEGMLLRAIEKEMSEPSSENHLQEISTLAQTLIELWKCSGI